MTKLITTTLIILILLIFQGCAGLNKSPAGDPGGQANPYEITKDPTSYEWEFVEIIEDYKRKKQIDRKTSPGILDFVGQHAETEI